MQQHAVLFLKTKHIGDSIVLTSAISALPEACCVDVLCFKESAPIFEMNPRVRNVFVVPRHLKGWARFMQDIKLIKEIRAQQYDLLAQFSDDWRGAFLARMLNVKNSVARAAKKRPAFWSHSFKAIAKLAPKARHAAEQDVDLLRRLHLYTEAIAPAYQIEVPVAAARFVDDWLVQHFSKPMKSGRLVVIHAAARWKFKGIQNATWVSVIDDLSKRGYAVVLSGSSSDLVFNQTLANLCQVTPNIVSDFDLPKTAALIQAADLLVSIDSMAIHMASAVQTPVIALFGPTDDKVWSPWRVKHIVLALDGNDAPSFACRPCGLDGCAGSKISQCLYAISASQILAAIDDLLVG